MGKFVEPIRGVAPTSRPADKCIANSYSGVRLSVAVMHHPKRAHMIERVANGISSNGRDNVTIVEDTYSEGLMATARRAWHAFPFDATHHLVLQDDVAVCRDFVRSVCKVITHKPRDPIGLYAPRKVIEEARAAGSAWAVINDGVWGQAVLLPVPLWRMFFLWCDLHFNGDAYPHDDIRLMLFCLSKGLPVWTTVPSLVEHLCPSDSIIGYSNANRVARWFIGEHVSGTTVDWSKGLQSPPVDRGKGIATSLKQCAATVPIEQWLKKPF